MISADPTIPDALNGQAWNRYSYVGNDPLTFTDPNGYSWLSSFFHAVTTFFKAVLANPIVRAVAQIVLSAVLGPVVGIIAAAAAGAAIITGLTGGNLGQILRAGAIAGATALAFNIVGDATNAVAGYSGPGHVTPEIGTPEYAFNVAGHAGVGCLSAVASGGECGPGALSGAVGAAATPLVKVAFADPRNNVGDYIGGTAATGLIGGLASVAGGGKFENGAVTAAFGYMYNNCKSCLDQQLARQDLPLQDAFSPLDLIGGIGGVARSIITRKATTTLFRAVSEAEYADVIGSGVLRPGPNSYSTGKFFAESGKDALKWGNALEGGSFRVLQMEFPKSTANQFMRWPRLDGIGPARFGTFEQIGKPNIKPWSGP